jgi:predicted dehydrogenase
MKDLRIGVAGVGVRGLQLARLAHRPEEGSAVVAFADPFIAGTERARSHYGNGVSTSADYRDLLGADLDAVLVTAPDYAHETIAVSFLNAGLPVYLEKPMAITTAGCDRVLRAAMESGTPLYVGHNMRLSPFVLAMRRIISTGGIGEVKSIWCRHFVGHGGDYYFKNWHADRTKSTSLLLQKGAHDIDVIHWLAGGVTRRTSAFGKLAVYGEIADRQEPTGELMWNWLDPENNWPPLAATGLNPVVDVEDLSLVNLELDNGVLASYQQCHFTPDYWRNYTVIGTEGRLENFGDGEGAVIKVWRKRSDYRSDADEQVVVHAESTDHGGADQAILAEFLAFVRGEIAVTTTSPVGAREAVAAGVAATDSIRANGICIDVAAPAEDLVAYFQSLATPALHA